MVKGPIASLGMGSLMVQLDLNFNGNTELTFRLVKGKGPVFLYGQELVEMPVEEDSVDETMLSTETSEEETEANEASDEEDEDGKKKAAKDEEEEGESDSDDDDDDEEEETANGKAKKGTKRKSETVSLKSKKVCIKIMA